MDRDLDRDRVKGNGRELLRGVPALFREMNDVFFLVARPGVVLHATFKGNTNRMNGGNKFPISAKHIKRLLPHTSHDSH